MQEIYATFIKSSEYQDHLPFPVYKDVRYGFLGLNDFSSKGKRTKIEKLDELWKCGKRENSTGQLCDGLWNGSKYDLVPVDQRYLPITFPNEPQYGFKIITYDTRRSTGNKVWIIEDPRDFRIEISTDRFNEILQSCQIDQGRIMNKMYYDFGKAGVGKAMLMKA
jgi:hypothetical protein